MTDNVRTLLARPWTGLRALLSRLLRRREQPVERDITIKQGEDHLDLLVRCPEPGYLWVSLQGDLTTETSADVRMWMTVLGARSQRLVVDLGEVRHLDFTGIAALVTWAREMRRHGGHLRLDGVTGDTRQLFELAGPGLLEALEAAPLRPRGGVCKRRRTTTSREACGRL